jgi:DNA polymerase-3 subunit alpha (Gram-positive type)
MTEENLTVKYQKFLDTNFTVFDIETSGLDPLRDEILEIAALKFKGKEITGRFEALIQPSRAIPPEVEKIHGLNELYLLVNGRSAKEVMNDFMAFSAGSIIVGHNIKEFDWLFVLNYLQKYALAFPENKLIDTLELARRLLALPNFTLTNVAKHFGFEHNNAHRAMTDVEINAKVFGELMEILLGKEE